MQGCIRESDSTDPVTRLSRCTVTSASISDIPDIDMDVRSGNTVSVVSRRDIEVDTTRIRSINSGNLTYFQSEFVKSLCNEHSFFEEVELSSGSG